MPMDNTLRFHVYDTKYASLLYMMGSEEAQFKDHKALVSPAVAYRMSRGTDYQQFVIEQKTVPYNPDAWTSERRCIWRSNVSSANGYGMVAENTMRWLRKAGVNVVSPGAVSGGVTSGGEYVHPDVLPALRVSIQPDCLEIQHCQPPDWRTGVVERSWIYTMFETTHLPQSWVAMLNRAEHILVPSSWLVESWKEQGVTPPIDVYGHGIDPEVFAPLERPERETFTFLHYGQLSIRKGTDLVVEAFQRAFAGRPDVHLILKHTMPVFPVPLGIPNVEYIHAAYSKEQLRALMQRADCFVFPTRGEGFGLPPLEAMATGLPTIVTNWSGPADYADPDDTLTVDSTMSPSREFDYIYRDYLAPGETTGEWAEPKVDDLVEKMRWVVDHRAEARAMGSRAARRIAEQWTWSTKIQSLLAVLDAAP
jgi:glycosyltransferase involved in cell wall biosynthesis